MSANTPLTTRLTTALGLTTPVVLAPMDLVSGGRLAAAVTDAGGLGLIGGGYGDRDWLIREFANAGQARVGCGFITWSLARRPDLLDVALDHNPVAIMLSFGDPAPFVDRIHAAGAKVICQIHSVEDAREALSAGADILVAQGGEAGGHGTAARSTFTLVPEIADLAAATAPDTLVLAAGGIADGRTLAAALTLGADGALIGTRFWATTEALVPNPIQRHAIEATGDDTIRTSVYDLVRESPWPTRYTGRLLRNAFITHWHGRESHLATALSDAQATYRNAQTHHDPDNLNIIVGEAIGQIHDITPAAELVHTITNQAHHLLT
ncbi:nitronate monooxygenase [Nocardia terpenica]|uniref:NAD(P)H-dependent flavin oxidoreductase n=1 Tax=Nocardia terpenica TaxID=455432 RepID=UPI001895F5AF|nr:nitronate monooxygenase [Nocardia terpenica]MBF6059220.1 nitronate monooxygenase [Nocardia terpenica]MBF6103241.1 nitronate monooxygenase [Nocardia terpenica]MBF6110570.1 nitronate monooxygenase [Nocardia terpenica]MBF6116701.1 nitronate monooxygenase [Nocardia terpenica]